MLIPVEEERITIKADAVAWNYFFKKTFRTMASGEGVG